MYARLVTIKLNPGSVAATEGLAKEHDPIMRGMAGFKSVTFFNDDKAGQYGSFSVWADRKAAEAVSGNQKLQVKGALSSMMIGNPTVSIFEAYEAGR